MLGRSLSQTICSFELKLITTRFGGDKASDNPHSKSMHVGPSYRRRRDARSRPARENVNALSPRHALKDKRYVPCQAVRVILVSAPTAVQYCTSATVSPARAGRETHRSFCRRILDAAESDMVHATTTSDAALKLASILVPTFSPTWFGRDGTFLSEGFQYDPVQFTYLICLSDRNHSPCNLPLV